MTETERFLLTSVTHLHHVADAADHFGLIFFSVLFEKALERRRRVEVIFDGVLAFTGNDDDVLDAGGDAFFRDILNLRFVDDGEHFLWLSFGGGEEAGAETGGWEHSFADFARGHRVRW